VLEDPIKFACQPHNASISLTGHDEDQYSDPLAYLSPDLPRLSVSQYVVFTCPKSERNQDRFTEYWDGPTVNGQYVFPAP
jgi:hypothetical protein